MMEDNRRVILVIDDDPDLIETITDSLELQGGYQVRSAPDGESGLISAIENPPDCIVVDVRMPNLNGLQFVRALQGDRNTASIPIVMLSALVQDTDLLRGLLSGADAYLHKPVRLQDLLNAIERSIQLSQQQRLQQWRDLASSESINEESLDAKE
jgi:twitching motility two-component system response regulator PilH